MVLLITIGGSLAQLFSQLKICFLCLRDLKRNKSRIKNELYLGFLLTVRGFLRTAIFLIGLKRESKTKRSKSEGFQNVVKKQKNVVFFNLGVLLIVGVSFVHLFVAHFFSRF